MDIFVAEKLLLRLSSEGSLIHRRLRAPHFRHPWRSAEKPLLRFPHFRHPWRSAEKPLLRFPHFRHPWRSQACFPKIKPCSRRSFVVRYDRC
jgi:hypothetical protein